MIMGLMLVASCADDGGGVSPNAVAVSFTETSATLREDDGTTGPIEITAEASVEEMGRLEIVLTGTGVYGEDYTTEPAAVDGVIGVLFPARSQVFTFRIYPMEHVERDEDVTVIATLSNASGGVRIGNRDQYRLYLENVPIVSEAHFAFPEPYIDGGETSEYPYDIVLGWTRPPLSDATIKVRVTEGNMVYGEDYTTSPEPVDNIITLEVAAGSLLDTITLSMIDDDTYDEGKSLTFAIVEVTGGLKRGGQDQSLTFDIFDDEAPREIYFRTDRYDVYESPDNSTQGVLMYIQYETSEEGTLTIQLGHDMVYGEDFVLSPEPVGDQLTLTVPAGSTQLRFEVIALDNDVKHGDRRIDLEMIDFSGGIREGRYPTAHIILVDDE